MDEQTYFFLFPFCCEVRRIWYVVNFLKIWRVQEDFISQKLDWKWQRFGLVRCRCEKRSGNEETTWYDKIGSMKIHANLPKYRRDEVGVKNENPRRQWNKQYLEEEGTRFNVRKSSVQVKICKCDVKINEGWNGWRKKTTRAILEGYTITKL